MNERDSAYYLAAACPGHIAYSLVKDIREGMPSAMNTLTKEEAEGQDDSQG